MIYFVLFDKALKITWVKRLCSGDRQQAMETYSTILAFQTWR